MCTIASQSQSDIYWYILVITCSVLVNVIHHLLNWVFKRLFILKTFSWAIFFQVFFLSLWDPRSQTVCFFLSLYVYLTSLLPSLCFYIPYFLTCKLFSLHVWNKSLILRCISDTFVCVSFCIMLMLMMSSKTLCSTNAFKLKTNKSFTSHSFLYPIISNIWLQPLASCFSQVCNHKF